MNDRIHDSVLDNKSAKESISEFRVDKVSMQQNDIEAYISNANFENVNF